MSEVSCRTCLTLVDAVRERGIPAEELVRGLPFSFETLSRASNRIGWDDFTVVLENTARVLGGPGALEELATRYYTRAGGILGAIAATVVSVRPIYHMGATWYGPSLYACTRATCEDLPDGRIRQTIEILPGYRDSDLFFLMVRGALRTVPALMGQRNARVTMAREPRRGIFTITPPPALSLGERLWRAFSWSRVVARAEEELELYQDELQKGYEMARQMTARYQEQARRLDEERHERARAQQLLQQVQKLDAMGRLAGGIAHDFNNLLTAITGYAELARDRVHDDDPLAADLDEIRAVSERGAALVKQILAFSRRQMVAPERLELNGVLRRMESMLKRLLPESVRLSVSESEEPLYVMADAGQIEQIVVNLVVNARDAMPDGGGLEIALEAVSRASPGYRSGPARVADRYARLRVRDEGRGMDPETISRAFEPFFTTKTHGQGTGLGLSTVYGIVSQSGGTIDVESEVGGGTTVVVQLPLTRAGAVRGDEVLPEAPGGRETLLLVEDEEAVRAVMQRTLESRGYTVLATAAGEAALEVARTHRGPIDLLVSDVVLPGGDGRALARRIDSLRPELRGVLFVTGHARESDAEPAGPRRALLRKPFDPIGLLQTVRRLLDAPTSLGAL